MLKYGFIGFGQVGGMVADLAKKMNYQAIAINTANVDLNNLENLDKSDKVHLLGYEGAGKDRSVGQEAFYNHQKMIKDRIHESMQDCHVLFPIFALGGGTGSGMSGLVTEMLCDMYDDKVVAPIVFMPDSDESPRAIMNALEAFAELSSHEETGAVFAIDNKKIFDLTDGETLKQKYETARLDVLMLLDLFNKRTEESSEFSNFDEMDLLTVLSERGVAMVSSLGVGEEHIKNHEKLAERMMNSWKKSIFADTDMKQIARSALILDTPPELTQQLKLDTAFHSIGRPLEIFTGIFKSHDAKLHTLITGLPYPHSLLKELEENVEKNEKRLTENLDKVRTQSFAAKSCWTVSLKRKRKIKV